jgi:hypothetical protein
MKKKWAKKKLALGIGIVAGGVMMATTALASGLDANGYNIYKEALKNTHAVTSVTGSAVITVSDNGQTIIKANDSVKLNRSSQDMSGSFNLTSGNQVKSLLMYRQDGQTITEDKDSGIYNVMASQQANHPGKQGSQENPALAKDAENIVDLIVGNYQNYISLANKADGDKQVSLQLSGSQVPPLANAVASLMVKEGAQHIEKNQNSADAIKSAVIARIPQLVDDITLANVDIEADLNSQNLIKEQTANITITGKDAAGNNHEVVVSVDLNLSNYNNTTPDSVDLTGKQVKTIAPKTMQRFAHTK